MIDFDFAVSGKPITQGSKTARISGRRFKVGNQTAVLSPQVVLTELTDMARKSKATGKRTRKSGQLTAWREAIALEARRALGNIGPRKAFFRLHAEFVIPRPPSHFKKDGTLRKSAPDYPLESDLDKLVRAVGDCLKGVVWTDDNLIRKIETEKRYATGPDKRGGLLASIRQLGPELESSNDKAKADAV